MHILFVHRTFPSQFGHLGEWLAKNKGWQVTFVSASHRNGRIGSIENIQYQAPPDPAPGQVIPWTRDFERQLMLLQQLESKYNDYQNNVQFFFP